jgi:hypothetical protein
MAQSAGLRAQGNGAERRAQGSGKWRRAQGSGLREMAQSAELRAQGKKGSISGLGVAKVDDEGGGGEGQGEAGACGDVQRGDPPAAEDYFVKWVF